MNEDIILSIFSDHKYRKLKIGNIDNKHYIHLNLKVIDKL